jgi:ribosomal protein S18 acetylase RimI-like enzyme
VPADSTDVVVEEVTAAGPEVVEALHRLLPQLSSSAAPPTEDDVRAMAEAPAVTLLVARLGGGGRIVGSLALATFRVPTGLRAWIEDVVVDASARGKGVGAALTDVAVERARAMGCRNVDLTSRPSREAANRLYQRLGFVARQTNVYRKKLEIDGPAD